MKKLFVIRKIVLAEDVVDAVAKEKEAEIIEVWLDEDWRKAQVNNNGIPDYLIQKE